MATHWSYDFEAKNSRLKSLNDIPKYPHFALMIVEQRSYSQAGYDKGDQSTTGYYDHVEYFAFTIEKKSSWEKLISDIYAEMHSVDTFSYRKKPEIIFFKSSGRGEVNVKINVNVDIKE